MKSVYVKIIQNKHILKMFTAVVSLWGVVVVSLCLSRVGIAMTGEGVSVSEDGYVTITEEAVPVATGTNGGVNCTWSVYQTDEGYVLYVEVTDIGKASTAKKISDYAADYFEELVAVKVADGITAIGMDFAYNASTLITADFSECTTITSINDNAFRNDGNLKYFLLADNNALKSMSAAVFSSCGALESFPFEKIKNATYLGGFAFSNCSKIQKADLSSWKLTEIKGYLFYGCSSLKEVILPEDNQINAIGEYAFYNCAFEEFPFDILSNVDTLGTQAFLSCTKLKTVDLSHMAKLSGIPQQCFQNCTSLTEVNFDNLSQVTAIGSNCFNKCTSLQTADLSSMTNLDSIGTSAFYSCSSLTKVTLPEDNIITSIGANAFHNCLSLLDFNFETLRNIVTIGSGCFSQDAYLECVDLSNATKLTEISSNVFGDCTRLYHVYLPDDNMITNIGSSAFYNTAIVSFPFEKLDKLETLGEKSFGNAKNLQKADFSTCLLLTSIPANCFQNDSSLKTVLFSQDNELQLIGGYAFYACSSLKEFNFENLNHLKEIHQCAFMYSGLEKADFPLENEIIKIGNRVFCNCSKLKEVSFLSLNQIEGFGDGCFSNTAITEADLSNCVDITVIPSELFMACKSLTTVKFPENSKITTIGNKAFTSCGALKELDGTNLVNLTTIGHNAFNGCTTLALINFRNCKKLTTISPEAFTNCSNLTYAYFTNCESLSSVAYTMFNGWHKMLKAVDFSGCSSLTGIPKNLFKLCPSLENVNFTGCTSLTAIGSSAFQDCVLLKTLTGLETTPLKTIGDNAFANCSGLQSIDIMETITTIGTGAFSKCAGLETINYNSDIVTSVGENAFFNAGGANGVTINIPNNINKVCGDTFNTSMNIRAVNFAGVNESLVLGENALKAAGVPLSSMSDGTTEYYVDADGVVYSKDKTVLYYIPAGIESYEVPDSVTKVASNSCAMADDLVSLSFTDITKIEILDNQAMADCVSLSAIVNGDTTATTVEAAAALFTNAQIGTNVFYNTGLLNGDVGTLTSATVESKTMIDEETIEYSLKTYFVDREHGALIDTLNSNSKRIPDIENPNADVYYYLTNEIAKMNIILSANAATQNKYCRVYFQCSSDDMVFDFKVGEENTISTDEGKTIMCYFYNVPGTNLYYLEFACEPGGTIGLTTSLYYENLTGVNETVKVWSQIVESTEAELKIAPDVYQMAQWYTAIQQWSVTKKGNTTLSYITAIQKDGEVFKRIDKDISYTITGTCTYGSNQDENDTYGADPAAYITYKDTITLPDGIYWDSNVIESVKRGDWYYAAPDYYSVYSGTIYVKIGSGYTAFATINKSLYNAELIYDEENRKIVLYFTLENTKLRAGTTTNNKWEMDNISVNLILNADEIFVVGDDYDLSKKSTIINTVEQSISYAYAKLGATEKHTEEVFQQTASVNTDIPVSNTARLKIQKDWSNKGVNGSTNVSGFGGEKIDYTITVKNAAAVECNEAMVKDTLQSAHKISPDDMEKMFGEEFGKQLVITIKNGYLQPLSENNVTGINGTNLLLEPIDKGAVLENSQKANDITIKWSENGEHLTVSLGAEVYEAGEGKEYTSIKEILNHIGFLNRWETVYDVRWYVPQAEQVMSPADSRVYMVYASMKNSYEKLLMDKIGDVFEGTKSSESVAANKATVYYDDSYTTSVTATASKTLAWVRDYNINKSMKIDGILVSEDDDIKVNSGNVLDFSIAVNHYGNSVEQSVPLNDKMSGIMAAIALVSENKNAYIVTGENEILLKDAGLEIYTDSRGRDYYILSKPGTYKNVKIGRNKYKEEYTSDRVIVSAEGAVLHTEIYWYFEEINGVYSDTITYQAIVRDDLGAEIANGSYNCSNMAYLNERPEDRLDDGILFSGNVVTSEKYIVAANPALEEEELVKYSELTHGQSVTYKLSITNHGEKYSKAVKIAYDTLPATYGKFAWSKMNVQIDYVSSTGLRNQTVENWKITNQSPSGTVDTEKGIYYIYWNDSENAEDTDSDIVLAPNENVDFYVTLQFPDNDDGQKIWDAYETKVMGDGNAIYNTLNVNGDNTFVQHALKVSGEAVLQKGVYGIYAKADNTSSTATYHTGILQQDRNIYTNSGEKQNFVTYYVAVYNSGNARLYLNDMTDVLPEGFTFNNLCSVSGIGNASSSYMKASWRGTDKSSAKNSLMTYAYKEGESEGSDIENLLCRITDVYSDTAVEYISAKVSASVKNGKINFDITQDDGNILYDEEVDMCYLEKGQALVFGYIADIGNDYETTDYAKNTLAMQYYDYNGAGVRKSDGVTISGQYLVYPESVNEGSQEILSNIEAEALELGGTYKSDWLCSNVSVTRGDLVPGIAKSIVKRVEQNGNEAEVLEGGLCEPNDTEVWEISFLNDGNKNLASYTITETMQAPYYFTGDVKLRIYDAILNKNSSKGGKSENNSAYTGTTGNVNNDTLIKNITFTDGEGAEISKPLSEYDKSDIKVKFKTEITTVNGMDEWVELSYETALGEAVRCQYQWFYWSGNKDLFYYMTVLFDVDDDGNCVMKITFDSDDTGGKTTIAAYGGKATMTVKTKKPSGVTVYSNFINKAMLSPAAEYEYDTASSGIVVRDETGESIGIESSSMFTVKGAYTTTSWKTVTDNSDTTNRADSRNNENYITLLYNENKNPHYSDFTYTLNVQNRCESDAINKMIVIDNLPEVDDHMAYASEASKRNSEYTIALKAISDSAITVVNNDGVSEEILPREPETDTLGYSVEFSTETLFTSSDWSGSQNAKWISFEEAIEKIESGEISIEALRSFRIIVSGGEGIARNNILTVSVDAMISAEAGRGKLAWNNFGYKYYINNSYGAFELSASSLNVGVMTATIPKIRKVLETGTGEPISAKELGMSASFIVYKGSRIEYQNKQELLRILNENHIDFSVLKVSGEDIDNQNYVEFADLMVCRAEPDSNGTYVVSESMNKWTWDEGEDYTFTEVDIPEHVLFSSLQNGQTNSYTITYERAGRYNISCKNIYDDYNLVIYKISSDTGDNLVGADFARYGVITGNPEDASYISELQRVWSMYVDAYIHTTEAVRGYDSEKFTLQTVDAARLQDGKDSGYEAYIEIPGVKAVIDSILDIGDDFCQFYTIHNDDGTDTTYYFMDHGQTDATGQISYKGIVEESFGFVEIAAPEGYTLEHRLYFTKRDAGTGATQYRNISNKPATELPMTGENGELKLRLIGMALMLVSMMAAIVRTKKRRKGGLES